MTKCIYTHPLVRLIIILVAIVASVLAATCIAKSAAVTVTYLGTEVAEAGQPPINVFHVDCDGENYEVTLLITFVNSATETRQGHYCQSKIYIRGSVAADGVTVAGILPDETATPQQFVFLPVVSR